MRPIPSISIAVTAVSVALLVAPAVSARTYCPRVLHRATRLIIVSVPDVDSTKATMRTFLRKSPAASWVVQSTAEPAVVGTGGIAWGHPYVSYARRGEPIKKEGDKRTPAGLYRLGATFGFAREERRGHLHLKPGAHYCVHDPKSPLYGHIVPRAKAGAKTSGEDMSALPLYKRGIVVDYAPRQRAKAGSCIFLHIWDGEGVGTAGCVALPEERVAHLQAWTKDRHAVIAILSEDMIGRFGRCLPSEHTVSAVQVPVALPLPNPKRGDKGRRAEIAR